MASVPQPQETWTNSWTCWTSGLMEQMDQSLDWDLTATLTTTSNISPRSDQKRSGQFNEWMDTDMDHGKKLKQRDIVPFEDMGLAQMLEDIPVNSNADEDFLDSFMDLTDFLLPDQAIEETEEIQNVIHLEDTEVSKSAFFGIDNLAEGAVICEEVDATAITDEVDISDLKDHDYSAKKPRLSPEPVVAVETKPSKLTSTSKSTKLSPDQKYRERRNKNNVASRRSREIRKMKFVEMEEEANRLIVVNAELKEKIAEMEKVAKDMKALLVQKLAAK